MDFATLLDRYASLAVRVGVNLQAGQRLLVRAPLEAAPLVRRLAAHAYDVGAPLVDVLWHDEALSLIRYRHARDGTLETFPTWQTDMRLASAERGDALISVVGADPDLLQGENPDRIATVRRVAQRHARPVAERTMNNELPWCVLAASTPAWAAKVFPDLPAEAAEASLWEAIFAATRIDRADPEALWREHVGRLDARADRLNARRYDALHYRGPGTDLRVGLPEGHVWEGGTTRTLAGTPFVANLPTEEVFTAPHRERVDGVVTSSIPLVVDGTVVESFALTFERGRVVDLRAERNGEALRRVLDTDDGARRLGEVALVPHDSPIARTGVLFFETLFDENAASHLALGMAYPSSVRGGSDMDAEGRAAAGLNDSLVHVDFMVGSAGLDVDGVFADGAVESLMRAGSWADPVGRRS